MSKYTDNLINPIINASKDKSSWEKAVEEWEIVSCAIDYSNRSTCICGKENIRYLYTIRNKHTGICFYPIGSSCISKFGRKDLIKQANNLKTLIDLRHLIEEGTKIELNAKYFTAKFILYLHENKVFNPNKYNNYNADSDCAFALKMFRKRNTLSNKQKYRLDKILQYSIIPYIMSNQNIY